MLDEPQIPPRAKQRFTEGIRHPDCHLWDAWSCELDDAIYLYTLAVSRQTVSGDIAPPSCRASSQFHVRQFLSRDRGASWDDLGPFQTAGTTHDGHDARNVWSGAVLPRGNGSDLWAAYTGIHEIDSEHPFLQCLAVGRGIAGGTFKPDTGTALLCPTEDAKEIRAAGYYIDDSRGFGSIEGESGGPILAWRDPYLFKARDQRLFMAWAAKRENGEPAMGLATLREQNTRLSVDTLLPPVALPDAGDYTQLEIPKIYADPIDSRYILIVASTNRRSENEDGSQLTAGIRIYHAESPAGPWLTGGTESSVLSNAENYFGMTVLTIDQKRAELIGVSPITDQASPERALTVSPAFAIPLADIGRAKQLEIRPILA